MAGIGIQLTRTTLSDADSVITLGLSQMIRSTDGGVTQDVYADGSQRSIAGFATRSTVNLTCQKMDPATYDWIEQRTGRNVVYRDPRGIAFVATIGGIREHYDARKGDEVVYGVAVTLVIVAAQVNDNLPANLSLEAIR